MTRPFQQDKISGFVLVGGASARMGRTKASIDFGGSKLFERPVRALLSICNGDIALVGENSGQMASFSRLPLKPVSDTRMTAHGKNERASIIGVHSALANSECPWAAVLACDLPFVTTELMRVLATHISDDVDAVVPVQPDGRPQPLCAIYNVDRCLPVIGSMLGQGELRMSKVMSALSVKYIAFEEFESLPNSSVLFLNINRPEDLERAAAAYSSTSA
jgi:molybdopterin-guanine dinucleotide biosynthesis protein A